MQAKAQTGTTDATYDVVSVLYHALQGADLYARYCDDAEQEDKELVQFFQNAQQQQRQIADQAKRLLAQRLG